MIPVAKKSLIVAAILAASSSAALAVPFAVEGKLTRIDAVNKEVECNGTRVKLVDVATTGIPATVYTTPTSTISFAQLASDVALPGQTLPAGQSAFIGGTCIIDGNSDATGTILYAETFFVEIAENVLVGPTTNLPGQPFAIAGVPIVILGDYDDGVNKSVLDPYAQYEMVQDPVTKQMVPRRDESGNLVLLKDANGNPVAPPRIHSVAPTNQFGYEVDLKTVPQLDESSAEGHMMSDGKFYAHVIETSGGERKDLTVIEPTATVLRANGRIRSATRIELEIRGGCEFKDPTLTSMPVLIRVDNGDAWVNPNAPTVAASPSTTNATCTREVGTNGGVYTYKRDYNKPAAYAQPTKVIVRVAAPAGATAAYADSPAVTLTLR